VPHPEEYVTDQDVRDDVLPRPPRCVQGAGVGRQCTREAKVWRHGSALCEEHGRAWELTDLVNDWALAEEITGHWLRMARVWDVEDLIRLADQVHSEAARELQLAKAKQQEAIEWASRAMDPREHPGPEEEGAASPESGGPEEERRSCA
jgi:hypothetical protein